MLLHKTISPKHRTWTEITPTHLQHNLRAIKQALPQGTATIAVIKANAYGHGALIAADALKELADCFMVAEINEALALKNEGVTLPILIAGYTDPDYAPVLAENGLIQCVFSAEYGTALHHRVPEGQRLKVHIKADTGMGRLGFPSQQMDTVDQIASLCRLPRLDCEGIFSHFAQSEAEDGAFTKLQEERFGALIQGLYDKGIRFRFRHISNSASGMLGIPSFCNGVRIGISLYGAYPSPYVKERWLSEHPNADLKPVMKLKTRIIQIRSHEAGESVGYNRRFVAEEPTRIAVLAAGYADGLPRLLSRSPGAPVISKDIRLVGSVCMDMCFADVTHSEKALIPGDEVTLFGSPEISADDWAAHADTISYEIFCNVSARVPRLVTEEK